MFIDIYLTIILILNVFSIFYILRDLFIIIQVTLNAYLNRVKGIL